SDQDLFDERAWPWLVAAGCHNFVLVETERVPSSGLPPMRSATAATGSSPTWHSLASGCERRSRRCAASTARKKRPPAAWEPPARAPPTEDEEGVTRRRRDGSALRWARSRSEGPGAASSVRRADPGRPGRRGCAHRTSIRQTGARDGGRESPPLDGRRSATAWGRIDARRHTVEEPPFSLDSSPRASTAHRRAVHAPAEF